MNSLPENSPQRWAGARRALDSAARWWAANDPLLYALFALVCTTYVAATFYGYMHVQTRGQWSAPLDDVFIHFDYARSFARGFPFQWSEGNGYSSGNTSLTYPIVLGVGYWAGFRGLQLMLWAAIVAGASVFGFLLLSARLLAPPHADLGRPIKYLLPPAVLSLGALDWSLFSGMENAVHLLAWGLMMAAVLRQIEAPTARSARWRAWWAGLLGALLVATRPESAICVAVVGIYCAASATAVRVSGQRRRSLRAAVSTVVAIGSPAVLMLAGILVANRLLTGEHQANGAIAKLFINNPYMSAEDMWDRYLSLLRYIVPRLVEHHFADGRPWGYLVVLVGLLPLLSKRTRTMGIVLWAQIVGWLLLVGLNNQLRWHNERYAMPAVAWLLVLATMGLGWLGYPHPRAYTTAAPAARRRGAVSWMLRAALTVAIATVYWQHQAPRFRDQVWFFGRAARNILDQHVAAGRLLASLKVRRVLVGDAGALMYASDRPGLDLIGLGGFRALPFARSTVHGLGASLELIERMAPADRPDVMAIYPSWWADLPTYFGRYITAIPVTGNVICGGSEKVIFEADWSAMDRRSLPRTAAEGERVVDRLDVADLLSERAHDYQVVGHRLGFVQFRVLDDAADSLRDLFDAGRAVPAGWTEQARLTSPGTQGRLILRVAPTRPTKVAVSVDGQQHGVLRLPASDSGWQEVSMELPSGLGPTFELRLTPLDEESAHFHLWVVEKLGRRE